MSASVRFSFLYAAIFFNPGVFTPFYPLFLTHQGFDAAAVGMLLALSGPARAVGNPLMLWLIDLGASARVLLVGAHVIGAAIMATSIFVASFWPMALLLALASLIHAPTAAVVDLTVTRATRRDSSLRYGQIRLWGSISFIAATMIGGFVVQRFSPAAAVWLLATSMIVGAMLYLLTPREPGAAAAPATSVNETALASPVLALAALIIASAMIQASHSALYGFSSIHWRALGYSGELIGLLWVISALAEILLFARFSMLAATPRGALHRLAIAGGIAAFRWAVMAFDPPLWATVMLQGLHAFSFGMTHLAAMAGLSLLAPYAWRGRVQGLHAGLIAFLTSGSTLAAGYLYERHGVAAYGLMVALTAIGALFVALAWRLTKTQPQSAGSGG